VTAGLKTSQHAAWFLVGFRAGQASSTCAKSLRRNQAVDETILHTKLMAIVPHKQAGHSMKNESGL
jgi:hypothetical protein